MILILCVDDNLGYCFNHRRQSRDRVLSEFLLNRTSHSTLWMAEESLPLFETASVSHLRTNPEYLTIAGEGEYCFCETDDPSSAAERIEKILLCRWNRKYPSDHTFSFPGGKDFWLLTESIELTGFSHPIISVETYCPV